MLERVAYRPLRHSPRLAPLITAIGMSIFLQNYILLGQGSRDVPVPGIIDGAWFLQVTPQLNIAFSYSRITIILVAIICMAALTLFMARANLGRACRACSQDIRMAALLGIDANMVIAFTFVLGATLASTGGILIGVTIGKINPFIGFIAGIKAFTAAVLGGIGSIPGAMLGGVILGLAETFAAAFMPSEYKDIVAFSLLALVLLFRPVGILGVSQQEKV